MSRTGGDDKYHNHEEVVGELTDCLLFFVNLCLACNVDCEELFDSFIKTQNKVRKRNGSSEVKYE
jgi:phosphoribosyl-ATP pyrophosphohydrolase